LQIECYPSKDKGERVMKFGILSDTHLNLPLALKAVKEMGDVDFIVHLGDHISDALRLEMMTGIPFRKIRGNGDIGAPYPAEDIFYFGSYRVVALHGDEFDDGGNISFDAIVRRAKATSAHIFLFGHFHKAINKWIDGILFINPGHMCLGSLMGSYGIVELDEGVIDSKIIEMENTTIKWEKEG
jgi:putative phosphoesterase